MKRYRRALLLAVFVVALIWVTLNVRITYADSGAAPRTATYDLSWYSIDGGGVTNLSGGVYTLSGAIGQPDAGTASREGYTLKSGFWVRVDLFGYSVNLPLLQR